MRKTLVQTLCAAFCAILCAHLCVGGGCMNIGARTAAWSGGGAPTARDYVQDGLIAMWDGIENAGWGQHDSSATVWKDLVGIRDIPLDKAIVHDKFVSTTNVSNSLATNDTFGPQEIFTIEFVGTLYGNELGYYGALSGVWGGVAWNTSCFCQMRARNRNGASSWKSMDSFSPAFIYTQEYLFSVNLGSVESLVAVRLDSSNNPKYNAFHNGINLNKNLDSTPANGLSTARLSFVANDVYGAYSKGDMYAGRVYSRALTAAEIAANYAVDKARFGLT